MTFNEESKYWSTQSRAFCDMSFCILCSKTGNLSLSFWCSLVFFFFYLWSCDIYSNTGNMPAYSQHFALSKARLKISFDLTLTKGIYLAYQRSRTNFSVEFFKFVWKSFLNSDLPARRFFLSFPYNWNTSWNTARRSLWLLGDGSLICFSSVENLASSSTVNLLRS